MAGLKKDQFPINLDTVYELKNVSDRFGYINPRLFFDGGEADVYVSEELPASKAEMVLQHTGLSGVNYFTSIPNYIYVEESSATVSNVIVSGVEPLEV